MNKIKYGITIYSGIESFSNPNFYRIAEICQSNTPKKYKNITYSSMKRLEKLIEKWDKRVYFGYMSTTIVAFNPNVDRTK